MSDLLFIRHAETDMAGTFCGHTNPPLNARGYEQIQTLLRAIKSEPIGVVCTSDLLRAVTTAEALAHAFSVRYTIRTNLREIGFGEWEDLCWKQIEQKDSMYARRWIEAYPNLPAPGGEPFEAFQSRVMTEVKYLLNLAVEGCVAVVTHAGVMRFALRALCGFDEQEAWQRTNSYCCFFRYAGEVSR